MPPKPQPDSARRLLLTLWLTAAVTLTGAGLVAALAWHLTPPLHPEAAFYDRYTVLPSDFLLEQPRKNAAFASGCLATPFLLILAFLASRRALARCAGLPLRVLARAGLALTFIFAFWCLFPLVHCPDPPFVRMPPSALLFAWFFKRFPYEVIVRTGFVILFGGLAVAIWRSRPTAKNRNRVLAVLVALLTLTAPSQVYAPSELTDDWRFTFHLNALFHAVSQVIGGRHMLVDFPHIYGGYVEFLGPLLRLFPHRIGTVFLAFGLMHILAILALLLTARLIIRRPGLLFLTGLALLAEQEVNTALDHYYQYFSIRTLFPAFGLLVAALYFRRPNRIPYGILSVGTAVATIWNLDTGVVLWMSWTAALTAAGLGAREPRRAGANLALQVFILAGTWTAFFLYLRLFAGAWPDLGLLFCFHRLYVTSGYFCLGMLFPDVWVLLIALYGVGLAVALAQLFHGSTSGKGSFLLMLSLLGLGLFEYFMGRSAEGNLVGVSYPFILLAGLLLDETGGLVRLGRLPAITWAYLAPVALIFSFCAGLFILAQPELLIRSMDVLNKWQDGGRGPIETNFAFVTKWTRPQARVYMLSYQSGFYHYLTGTVSPIRLPGPGEIYWTSDIDDLAAAIDGRQFDQIFVDQDYFESRTFQPVVAQRIMAAITARYHAQAASADGRVVLYVPW